MIKAIKVFSLFILCHSIAWASTHFYLKKNQPVTLLVVDTSYSMKTHFPKMIHWINRLKERSRYQTILIGTDKAMLGPLDELKSTRTIFRTAFGKMQPSNLSRYQSIKAHKRVLLSDGKLQPKGWKIIHFSP